MLHRHAAQSHMLQLLPARKCGMCRSYMHTHLQACCRSPAACSTSAAELSSTASGRTAGPCKHAAAVQPSSRRPRARLAAWPASQRGCRTMETAGASENNSQEVRGRCKVGLPGKCCDGWTTRQGGRQPRKQPARCRQPATQAGKLPHSGCRAHGHRGDGPTGLFGLCI